MKRSYLTRKESIILSAIEIIDEIGLHELSTRELARKQGVSDASLYKHFKSKQEIILAVLDYYSNFDSMIIKTIESSKLEANKNIMFFYKSFAEYYENYPSISAITNSYELLLHDEAAGKKVEDIYQGRSNFIKSLVVKAQLKGEIKRDYDSEELTDALQGLFINLTLKWRIKKYKFSLKERVVSAVEMLLKMSK